MKRREFLKAGVGAVALGALAPMELLAKTPFTTNRHLDCAINIMLHYLGEQRFQTVKEYSEDFYTCSFSVNRIRYDRAPQSVFDDGSGYVSTGPDGKPTHEYSLVTSTYMPAFESMVEGLQEWGGTKCRVPTLEELEFASGGYSEHFVQTKDGLTLCLSVGDYFNSVDNQAEKGCVFSVFGVD